MSRVSRRGLMGIVAGAAAAPALVCEAVAGPGAMLPAQTLEDVLRAATEPVQPIQAIGLDLALTEDEIAKHGAFLRNVILPGLSVLVTALGGKDWPLADLSLSIEPGEDGKRFARFDITPDLPNRLRLDAHIREERIKAEAAAS